jgi:hypothetical protein
MVGTAEALVETGLSLYDNMCSAIAACHRLDEAKTIRDQAEAMRVYFRLAQNREAEHQAIEIRIRAERRSGELLKLAKEAGQRQNEKGSTHRPSKKVSSVNDTFPKASVGPVKVASRDEALPTLADIGITRNQSSAWQKLAKVPEKKFEAALATLAAPSAEAILHSIKAKAKQPPAPPRAWDLSAGGDRLRKAVDKELSLAGDDQLPTIIYILRQIICERGGGTK